MYEVHWDMFRLSPFQHLKYLGKTHKQNTNWEVTYERWFDACAQTQRQLTCLSLCFPKLWVELQGDPSKLCDLLWHLMKLITLHCKQLLASAAKIIIKINNVTQTFFFVGHIQIKRSNVAVINLHMNAKSMCLTATCGTRFLPGYVLYACCSNLSLKSSDFNSWPLDLHERA